MVNGRPRLAQRKGPTGGWVERGRRGLITATGPAGRATHPIEYFRIEVNEQEGGIIVSDKGVPEGTDSDLMEVIEELKRLDLDPKTLRRHLLPLLDRPAKAIPLLLLQFESEDEKGLVLAVSALKAMNDPSLVPLLLNLLRRPHVDSLAKGLLLNLLEYYGFDTRDPSLIGASIDLREVLEGPGSPRGIG